MEILKRGVKPEDQFYLGTCHKCGTEVKFQRSEGVVTQDQRDGNFISVNCPVCGNKIHANL